MFFLKIVRLLVFSNVFIACCAVGLQLFCRPIVTHYESALLFFAVLGVYSVLKLAGNKHHALQPSNTAIGWLQRNTSLQYVLAITAFTGVLFFWQKLHFVFYLSWGIALGLLLFYAFFRKVHVLSMFPSIIQAFMKIGVVAAVWSFVLLPFDVETSPLFLSIYLFIFILALMIPFEIRDMQHDAPFHVPTVPLLLGEVKSKQMAYVLLVCSFLMYLCAESSTIERCAVGLTSLFGCWMVRASSSSSSGLFFLLGIDGLLLLPYTVSSLLHIIIDFYHTFF